jgi:hypothetical protein
MQDSQDDEVERLLSRMESVEPPRDFFDRVLAQTTAAESQVPTRRSSIEAALYAVAYLAALVGLTVLAFDLGLSIAHSGTGTLVSELLADVTLFRDAPGPYIDAIAASLPWLHLAAVAFDLALLVILTRLAFDGGTSDRRRAPPASV